MDLPDRHGREQSFCIVFFAGIYQLTNLRDSRRPVVDLHDPFVDKFVNQVAADSNLNAEVVQSGTT